MVDGFIPATPGSGTGNANVETSQLTRTDGTVVQRERITIGDTANVGNLATVGPKGLQVDDSNNDLLKLILIELKVTNTILAATLGYNDDPDLIRSDVTLPQDIPQ